MARKINLMNHALIVIMLPAILFGCSLMSTPPGDNAGQQPAGQETPAALEQTEFDQGTAFNNENKGRLPVQYQKPAYAVKSLDADDAGLDDKKPVLVVGATISSTTRLVPIRDILKKLAALKDMNISWSSDVDQHVPVDVNIRADDDFYKAIENLLRQVDYFYEIQGNTIVVKYKETRKFHIAMPFLSSAYAYGVGGDVLGGGESTNMSGMMQLTSEGNTFDIWDNITSNLDKVLDIWTSESETTIQIGPRESSEGESEGESEESTTETPTTYTRAPAKGYYTIDKPIGLITVTAPRPLLEKISVYLDNLKSELYRQISIEAKIIEVTLNNTEDRGIDWSNLLNDFNLNFNMAFGQNGRIWPDSGGILQTFSMDATKNFSIVIDALDTQGMVNVLANPRINVMNGQPALISVGENTRFIDQVTTTVDEGIISYSVTTATVMSGLGMSVVAIILENNEIILTLTPVTTQLEKPVEYRDFGASTVGLPVINVREMSTTVRIKNGEMLVIGGLIDSIDSDAETKVPMLGNLPLINKLFSNTSKQEMKTELVILLRPQILL